MIVLEPTQQTIRLLNKFKHAPEVVQKAKRQGLIKATNLFRMRAVEKAPIRTGFLRKSILTEVKENVGRIYSKLDYALFQEMGTGIYGFKRRPITPKRARALRFKTRSGKIVYAKSVRGTRAKKFFHKASQYIQTQTKTISNEIIKVLKKEL